MPGVSGDAFLLWSELLLLWSIVSYAVASDPLPEDLHSRTFHWQTWRKMLVARTLAIVLFAALLSHSLILVCWLAVATACHPWMRLQSPRKWTAELEITAVLCNLTFTFAFARHFHLRPHIAILDRFDPQHVAAGSIVLAIFLFTVRGGTYVVRGCLRKAGTLPHLPASKLSAHAEPPAPHQKHPKPSHPASSASSTENANDFVDLIEINRGRLIGNLERLVLTIVVAAGSYAALAFLVAAKGLIRSIDLQDRDFAEYFLIGSLASVLVALCAGMIIRFTLAALWPELLALHIQ